MRLPRFHLRTLMIAVGIIATLCVDFHPSASWWEVKPVCDLRLGDLQTMGRHRRQSRLDILVALVCGRQNSRPPVQCWLHEGAGLATIWRAMGAVRALELAVLAIVFISLTAVALRR